jgi:4-hydroxy-tetrahydrodipicolinate synthase
MTHGIVHARPMEPHGVDLTGLWIPIVTPFDRDDAVDGGGIETVAARLFADGARGLVALGTTGEPATLSAAERTSVIELCDEQSVRAGRPLIVGTGTNSTRATVAATAALARYRSVCATLVVVPYYTRPTVEGIVEHYRVVAAESPVPVIAYNVPYRTGRALGSADLLRVAGLPNVAGVKQAVGALDADTLQVLADAPPSFQ